MLRMVLGSFCLGKKRAEEKRGECFDSIQGFSLWDYLCFGIPGHIKYLEFLTSIKMFINGRY